MWELVKVGSWVTFILYLWPSVYTKVFELWLLGRLRWRRMEASLSWLSLLGWHRKVACLGFRIFFKSRWRRCSHPVRRAKVTSSFHKSCFSFKRISVPGDFCSVPSSESEHGAAPCAVQAVQQRLGTLSSPEGSQTTSSQSHVFVGNSSSLKTGTALWIILTYLSE